MPEKKSYSEDSRKPAVETGTLEDDQKRRDFTVNALAISLNAENFGELIDPFNGREDMQNKILRTPLEPAQTYSDDPLRMMRAIRFASVLHFEIEKNSLESHQTRSRTHQNCFDGKDYGRIQQNYVERKPSVGLKLMEETTLLEKKIIPELTALKGIEEVEGQTHKDNFGILWKLWTIFLKNTDNLWLRWAALLHDIGKAPTKNL